VIVASRIVALAEPGRICISERVYEEIRNQRGMAVKSLGQKNLKNVSRPIGVYVLSLIRSIWRSSICAWAIASARWTAWKKLMQPTPNS
jgi:class 3 adenylate cyclase